MADEQGDGVQPIPFVLVGDDGGFSVNPEACAKIEAIRGKLVIIAVAGLYRTGKSFLLNLLVRHAKGIDASSATGKEQTMAEAGGFAVGGTVNACTKGIWMWGEPIVMEDGTNYLFLDTEGLGSVDREQTHDTRIFALALLLATNFIYNSRGVIDGNAIEDLSLVVNLSKHIQTSQKDSSSGGGADFHEFFPSFMWVVRDFTLQLLDNGKKISSKQYLENALAPQGGYSDDAVKKDQIRLLLSDFFHQRDCVTLVRPVDDEQKLRALPSVPYDGLRDEFRSAFETLRRRLFEKAKPKMLYGKMLNGAMFVNLVKSYVEALNSGKAPVISSAWSRVVQAQCDDALHDAIEAYKKELTSRVRVFTSPEQYQRDEDFETRPVVEQDLTVIDNGQGDAMFDEYGNLRSVPVSTAGNRVSDAGSVHKTDEDYDNELVDVMEEEAGDEPSPESLIERTRLPCAEETLLAVHRRCKRIAKKKLRDVIEGDLSDDSAQYLDKFRSSIESFLESFKQQNAAASMTYCRHVLEDLSASAAAYLQDSEGQNTHKSAMQLFRETQTYLSEDLDRVHDAYFTRAVGPSADAAYCEFVSQTVVNQVIHRSEKVNVAHMSEVRSLEKQLNEMSVKVATAQGQASAMQELSVQQQQKSALTVKEAEERCKNELIALRSTLDFKTNELEHVLNHNATLKRLADTAQQGQYRATEFAVSAFSSVLAGYLIKQQGGGAGGGGGLGGSALGSSSASSRGGRWHQRYFVLQGNQLSFYDTKDDYERVRSDNPPMDVSGALIEDQFAIPEAFSISFADNKYFPLHLHAKSLESKREWVDSLRRAAMGNRLSSFGGGPPSMAPPMAPAGGSGSIPYGQAPPYAYGQSQPPPAYGQASNNGSRNYMQM